VMTSFPGVAKVVNGTKMDSDKFFNYLVSLGNQVMLKQFYSF